MKHAFRHHRSRSALTALRLRHKPPRLDQRAWIPHPLTSPSRSASSSRAATASPKTATTSSSSWPACTPARSSPPTRPRPPPRQLRVRRRSLPLLAVLHAEVPARLLPPVRQTPPIILHPSRTPSAAPSPALSVTPIILRWNFAGTGTILPLGPGRRRSPLDQPQVSGLSAAPPYNSPNDGPNADTSVCNFTPQGGIGLHYFIHPRRSIDFSANGVHISTASLGDRNPGVNASVQFSLGYTWWK